MFSPYPVCVRLGVPQSRSGCFEEEENLLPVTRTAQATLSRLFRAISFQLKQETCILLITSYEIENPN